MRCILRNACNTPHLCCHYCKTKRCTWRCRDKDKCARSTCKYFVAEEYRAEDAETHVEDEKAVGRINYQDEEKNKPEAAIPRPRRNARRKYVGG